MSTYILCIETTSTNCSVAIATINTSSFDNNYGIKHCLDVIEDNNASYSHGESLHIFIDEILKRNNLKPTNLNAVAVSAGPGSYTGLRIGVATAKGMCFALQIPLISIDTLTALSLQNTTGSTLTIPMLDARRMEVYASVFENGIEKQKPSAIVLEENSFLRFRESGTVTFIGTGIEKFRDLTGDNTHNYINTQPSALTMCDLAVEAKKTGNIVDVAYFEPFYLKEFFMG